MWSLVQIPVGFQALPARLAAGTEKILATEFTVGTEKGFSTEFTVSTEKSLATEFTEYTEVGKLVGRPPVLPSVVSVSSVTKSSFFPESSFATEFTEGTEIRIKGLIVLNSMPGLVCEIPLISLFKIPV